MIAVWVIAALILFYILLSMTLFQPVLTSTLSDHWVQDRCKLPFLPVAAFSPQAEGNGYWERTKNNFNYCTSSLFTSMSEEYMKPTVEVIGGITSAVGAMTSILNTFRTMSAATRDMFSVLVESVFNRISELHTSFTLTMERLKILSKKQSAVMEVLIQFLSTMPFMLSSFSQGPIPRFAYWMQKYMKALISFIVICLLCAFGGPFTAMVACPVCALCFDPATPVQVSSSSSSSSAFAASGAGATTTLLVPMRDVDINTTLAASGARVIGTLFMRTMSRSHLDLYMLPTDDDDDDSTRSSMIYVTGCHLVLNRDKKLWVRVRDHPQAIALPRNSAVACLMTEDGCIPVGSHVFRDYRECRVPGIWKEIHCKLLNGLNLIPDQTYEEARLRLRDQVRRFTPTITDVDLDSLILRIEDGPAAISAWTDIIPPVDIHLTKTVLLTQYGHLQLTAKAWYEKTKQAACADDEVNKELFHDKSHGRHFIGTLSELHSIWFSYKGCIVTGSLVVYDISTLTWRRVWMLPDAYMLLSKCTMPGYHMISAMTWFYMLGRKEFSPTTRDSCEQHRELIVVRDSLESHDSKLNEEIDAFLLSHLNQDA
jgi:hypothetical protein